MILLRSHSGVAAGPTHTVSFPGPCPPSAPLLPGPCFFRVEHRLLKRPFLRLTPLLSVLAPPPPMTSGFLQSCCPSPRAPAGLYLQPWGPPHVPPGPPTLRQLAAERLQDSPSLAFCVYGDAALPRPSVLSRDARACPALPTGPRPPGCAAGAEGAGLPASCAPGLLE